MLLRGALPLADYHPDGVPLAIYHPSRAACLALAGECERRGWRGPWIALASRAARLEPANPEALLSQVIPREHRGVITR